MQQHYRAKIAIVGREFADRYQTTDNTKIEKTTCDTAMKINFEP